MTLASAVTAWNQARHQNEVAQSYLGAAHALAEFQAVASIEVVDSQSLGSFVTNVEQSLARERATWLIRRSMPAGGDPDQS